MTGNGSIVWLMLSVLQAILAFTGVIPPELAILEAILGGNSIGFFIIFLYFMFRRKPKGFLDSQYDKDERTVRIKDDLGQNREVGKKSEGSTWEKWAAIFWFITLIVGTLSIL
tara:strand:- start:95 stop:433 length:339 start_codon:yes stop_codon:yes gene_type:complete